METTDQKITTFLAIDQARLKFYDEEDFVMADKLGSVLEFLPEFPVMALLEARYNGLPQDFCELIKSTYNVLDFK